MRHLKNILGDNQGLAPLLGPDARISARRIYQGNYGQIEFLGQFHLELGLAIALRMRASEMAGHPVMDILALAGADKHHFVSPYLGQAADHGRVVAERTVSVQRHEITAAKKMNVIGHLRPGLVPGQQNPLPRRQVLIDILLEESRPGPEFLYLIRKVYLGYPGKTL